VISILPTSRENQFTAWVSFPSCDIYAERASQSHGLCVMEYNTQLDEVNITVIVYFWALNKSIGTQTQEDIFREIDRILYLRF
jgi:hypothetical protein